MQGGEGGCETSLNFICASGFCRPRLILLLMSSYWQTTVALTATDTDTGILIFSCLLLKETEQGFVIQQIVLILLSSHGDPLLHGNHFSIILHPSKTMSNLHFINTLKNKIGRGKDKSVNCISLLPFGQPCCFLTVCTE